jgi:Zn-dependent peptidase ImmA (M78 family)/transcriptional regulator with XRE-family HTH domain
MRQLEENDPKTLGQRIAEARKARGVTQEDVAEFLGYSRPTYIAIEKGERPAKADEIIRLAGYFGRSVHELVRPGEPVVALQPHLRATAERMKAGSGGQLLDAIDELQRFAEDYRELEQLMNAPLRTSFPSEVKLDTPIDVTELAEGVAVQERRRLGLGDQPVIHLRSILEWDVGLRIFYGAKLPSAVAGMYAWTADLGCCILINRNHPPQRRRVSMVHEYGHLIVDRYKPGIDYLSMSGRPSPQPLSPKARGAGVRGRKPANERFAETFGLSFLMPASSVRSKFHEIVTTTSDFRVADLCRLSHFYFVSVEAMALRLEKLGLIPKGSSENLKESKFSPAKAAEMLTLTPRAEPDDPYPQRYKYLAVRAYEQGELGDSDLAHYLRTDVVTAREIVTRSSTSQEVEPTGKSRWLQLDLPQSLLRGVS